MSAGSRTEAAPYFSIITPSFNQGRYIERTIRSVLSQGFQDLEYLVFDGGSTDETVSILESFGDNVRWFSEPDRGQTHAVNKGLKAASGQVIGWLNSDDIYFPGALEQVYNTFEQNPGIDILYGSAHHIDELDRQLEPYYTEAWDFEKLKEVCYLCQPAVFFRRSLVDRFGFLDEKLNYCMDYEYWLRIGRSVPFYYLRQDLAGSRLYKENKTIGSTVPVHREILKMFKDNFRKIPSKWIYNYAHAVVRQQKLDRTVPRQNFSFVKKVVKAALFISLRTRYYIPLKELKTLAGWYRAAGREYKRAVKKT